VWFAATSLIRQEAAVVFEDDDRKAEMMEQERRINEAATLRLADKRGTNELKQTTSKSESMEHDEYKV
jgi:hypothetical protein